MAHSRRSGRMAAGALLAGAVALLGCGGDERPSVADWRPVWETRQALVPDADALVESGEDLCGERLGMMRSEMPDLTPTPSEALDGTVDEWAALAENIMFECPDDPAELDDRLETLDALASEIDAGLTADS